VPVIEKVLRGFRPLSNSSSRLVVPVIEKVLRGFRPLSNSSSRLVVPVIEKFFGAIARYRTVLRGGRRKDLDGCGNK